MIRSTEMRVSEDGRFQSADDTDEGMTLGELLGALRAHATLLMVAPLAAGALALGITYLIAPTFTARTTFMPPQQAQSSAASALASLGALSGLAGAATGVSSPGERYVALMLSTTVSDRLVDHFKLMDVYEAQFRVDARRVLAENVRIGLGKKDGLISVEVDDKDQQRAADIANRYVDELRLMTGAFAVTEAQQRRAFFEQHLLQSRGRLAQAQQSLEASGFSPGALKAEPRAAAESYARLKAEVTAAEMRLRLMRATLADGTTEVRQQQDTVAALREQLAGSERVAESPTGGDYITKYRDFKYQETLFDVYARQFELARADESREGALIQVVDPAQKPEKKSKPRRAVISIATTVATLALLSIWIALGARLRHARIVPTDVGAT